jgi:hypothetical protein
MAIQCRAERSQDHVSKIVGRQVSVGVKVVLNKAGSAIGNSVDNIACESLLRDELNATGSGANQQSSWESCRGSPVVDQEAQGTARPKGLEVVRLSYSNVEHTQLGVRSN